METDPAKWKCTYRKCDKKAYVNINSSTEKGIDYRYFCLKHFHGYALYVVDMLPFFAEIFLERDKNPKKVD